MADPTNESGKPIKLFLSHATEDKNFATPLADALREKGFEVWYDTDDIKVGQSLFDKISQGLLACDFGIVLLSKPYFRKTWTLNELKGLWALESAERTVLLPVWRGVSREDVKAYSPMLVDRYGIPAGNGVTAVVAQIQSGVSAARVAASLTSENAIIKKFGKLLHSEKLRKNSEEFLRYAAGSILLFKAVNECFASIKMLVGQINADAGEAAFRVKEDTTSYGYPILGLQYKQVPRYFSLTLQGYHRDFASETCLDYNVLASSSYGRSPGPVEHEEFTPFCPDNQTVIWCNDERELPNGEVASYFLEQVLTEIKDYQEDDEDDEGSM